MCVTIFNILLVLVFLCFCFCFCPVLNRAKQQDVLNIMGAIYSAVLFLGATNASSVQSVVAIERTVFYRERAAGMYSALPYAFAQVTKIIHPFKSSPQY